MQKQKVHFVDKYLLNPANPVSVNVIGVGGTGSQVLSALGRTNEALLALGHPGLFVRAFDDDVITHANKGRQPFADSEIGLPKAVVLINRQNCFFGTNWKAVTCLYDRHYYALQGDQSAANITITCVDTVNARFEVADILKELAAKQEKHLAKPYYWMDFGNSKKSGQFILSTVSGIGQPHSKKYRPVAALPWVTEEFKDLLQASEERDNTPSCSLADALDKQDLFINPSLANFGASLLWEMFRTGMTQYRGCFMNLADFRTTPITI